MLSVESAGGAESGRGRWPTPGGWISIRHGFLTPFSAGMVGGCRPRRCWWPRRGFFRAPVDPAITTVPFFSFCVVQRRPMVSPLHGALKPLACVLRRGRRSAVWPVPVKPHPRGNDALLLKDAGVSVAKTRRPRHALGQKALAFGVAYGHGPRGQPGQLLEHYRLALLLAGHPHGRHVV